MKQPTPPSDGLATQLAPLLDVDVDELTITPRPSLPHQRQTLLDVQLPGQHLIAKVFRPAHEHPDPATCEYRALQLVAPLDLAPEPVGWLPPLPPERGAVVVYAFLPGEMWDRTPPTADELAQLAEGWLRIHALPKAGLWTASNTLLADDSPARFAALLAQYEQWAQAHFPPALPVVEHCRTWLAQRRPVWEAVVGAPFVSVFCRSDPRFANFLRRPDGRLGMLDWERSGLRDPALDVASLLTHPNQEDLLTPEQWRAFLDPYSRCRRDVTQLCRRASTTMGRSSRCYGWRSSSSRRWGGPPTARSLAGRSTAWPPMTECDAILRRRWPGLSATRARCLRSLPTCGSSPPPTIRRHERDVMRPGARFAAAARAPPRAVPPHQRAW